MKIAYDGKRFFQNSSGLGNYSRDLVRMLATYFPTHAYLLLNKTKTERGKEILHLPNVSFLPTSKGSLARQLKMGKDAQNAGATLFHGLSGELPLKWNSEPILKVVTIHDLIFMRFPEYYSFFDRKIHFWKFKNAAKQADIVVAISEQTKQDIIHFLKVPEEKIVVVYQGCHHAFQSFIAPDFLDETRSKFGIPARFILNVGTIEKRKNLLDIVKAIDGSGIPLVVVGRKTAYYKEVKRYIDQHQLDNQVYFLENVSMEELAAIYRMSTFFVYPSVFEGFGIPVIEALFSGTPVITSNTSSLPEAGGPDSLYVSPGDVDDLRAKISFLWNNEAERKRRVRKSFDYVRRFTDEKIANDMMNVYEGLTK